MSLKAAVRSKSQFTDWPNHKQLTRNLFQKKMAVQKVKGPLSKFLREIVQIKKKGKHQRDILSMRASMWERDPQNTQIPPVEFEINLNAAQVKKTHTETHFHQSVRVRLPLWSRMNRRIGQRMHTRGRLKLRVILIETTKNSKQGNHARPPQFPNICWSRRKKSSWRSCVQGWKTQSSRLRGSSTKMKHLL